VKYFQKNFKSLRKMQKRKERESNISHQNWCSPENLALMRQKESLVAGGWHAEIWNPAVKKKKTTSVVELMLQLFASWSG
jgi:hypothetical protein